MCRQLVLVIGLLLSLQSWSLGGEERVSATQPPLAWKVGYAEADITPRPGEAVMLAGFGKQRIIEGTESPLRAQALAFEDAAGKRFVLLTADVLGFGRSTVDAVRHKLGKTHQLDPSAVCFASSHTHWGPAVNDRTGGAIGDPNVWYLGFLESTLLTLVDNAFQNLAAAEVSFGSTEVRIGMCRRLLDKDGQVHWAPDPNGSYDAHTPILHIRRDMSPGRLILVGHACHPTSMGSMNQWSPDYPGAMRRKLEGELDDCHALFAMGCGADAKVVYQDTANKQNVFAASPPLCYQAGEALADAVIARIRSDHPLIPLRSELTTSLVRGPLSLQAPASRQELERLAHEGSLTSYQTWWARRMLSFPDRRTDLDYAVQAWRMGDLTCIALEGEVCADWGPLARSLVATNQAMTIGYANEVSCYIPTARIVQEGGYEGDYSHKVYLLPSRFDPQIEVELTALIRRAVSELSGHPDAEDSVSFDRTRLLVNVDQNGVEHPITTPQQWEPRRRQIVAQIEQVTGPVPGPAFRVPLDLKVLEEVDCGSYIRKKISYNVDPYDRVESFLLVPTNLQGKTPAILALHGTNSAGKDLVVGLVEKLPHRDAVATGRRHYARELVERGYIVIAPDYWYYGQYRDKKYDPYQRGYASATMKGVWNHMRAIDLLETLPEVDANRIGVIGHSLGGYNPDYS